MPPKIKNEVETIFTADDRMTRQLSRMNRGIARMNRMARRAKKALMAAGRAAVFLGRKAAGIAKAGMLAMAAGAAAVFLSVTKLAGGMDDLAKTTRALNFPIEEFQEFKFAAEQAGVPSEKFGVSVKKFAKTVGELKGGYGAMFTSLKKTNPQLLKQLKATDDTSKAFEMYIKAIRETPGAMSKAALATAGFGRSGMDMVNMANLSAEELGNLRKEMRENGVVTAKQAAKAEVYNDMMNRLKLTLKGVAVDGLTPLMPLITNMMDGFRKWIVMNRGLIKQKIETVFKNMVKFGKIAFKFLKKNIPSLIRQIKKIGKDGFAWIKDNKKDIREFGRILLWIGKTLRWLTGFVWRNKEAILALAVAYKVLSVSMSAISFSQAAAGFGQVGGAVGGLSTQVKGLAGMLGKGGLLATAALAGVAVGTLIFDEWNKSASSLALTAENTAARVSLAFHNMGIEELKASDRMLRQQEKRLDSFWNKTKALLSGNIKSHNDATEAIKRTRIEGLKKQKEQLTAVAPQEALPQKIRGARAGIGAAAAEAAMIPMRSRGMEKIDEMSFGIKEVQARGVNKPNEMSFGRKEVRARGAEKPEKVSFGLKDMMGSGAANQVDSLSGLKEVQTAKVQPQVQTNHTSTTEKKEVEFTIKDETGRGELTKGSASEGIKILRTGDMHGAAG